MKRFLGFELRAVLIMGCFAFFIPTMPTFNLFCGSLLFALVYEVRT